jgi:hypothetical protein
VTIQTTLETCNDGSIDIVKSAFHELSSNHVVLLVKCFGDEILIEKVNNYNYINNDSSNNEFKYYDTDDVSISNLNFFVRAFENNETLNNGFNNNNNSYRINSSNNNNNSNDEFLISNFSPLLQGPININRGHHDGVKLCEESNIQNLNKTLSNKQNISNITEEQQTSTSKKTINSNFYVILLLFLDYFYLPLLLLLLL